MYVQNNVWVPGGTSGWHTHPGHSLIIVTAGTVTTYEADDPECTPHAYTVGMGIVDPGGGHVHNIRNEGPRRRERSPCRRFRPMPRVGLTLPIQGTVLSDATD